MTEDRIAQLEGIGLPELRALWRRHFDDPPNIQSKPFIRLMLGWRIQAAAQGGLDAQTRAMLRKKGSPKAEGSELGIGAQLKRNWKGREMVVTVEPDGFCWEGKTYPSLSAAATAISGSRWNGPRFFGLRDAP